MERARVLGLLVAGGLAAGAAQAHPWQVGYRVAVSVEVEGARTPLYAAVDGSGRYYLQAREGCRYAVVLANRTAERLGVVLNVDGLNVVSGQKDDGRGRMYVLDPWSTTTVQGWRTSLEGVRRFTFVDERASYAARSGKANRKMGWIEVAVFRERGARLLAGKNETDDAGRARDQKRTAEAAGPPASAAAPEAAAPHRERDSAGARSFPGTGWGAATRDRVVLVDFDPEETPSDRVTLRYEYRRALVALGVVPREAPRDRLRDRDRAEGGFAPPPLW
jgi:hypothetical protein